MISFSWCDLHFTPYFVCNLFWTRLLKKMFSNLHQVWFSYVIFPLLYFYSISLRDYVILSLYMIFLFFLFMAPKWIICMIHLYNSKSVMSLCFSSDSLNIFPLYDFSWMSCFIQFPFMISLYDYRVYFPFVMVPSFFCRSLYVFLLYDFLILLCYLFDFSKWYPCTTFLHSFLLWYFHVCNFPVLFSHNFPV